MNRRFPRVLLLIPLLGGVLSCANSGDPSAATGCDEARGDEVAYATTATLFTATQPTANFDATTRYFYWDVNRDNLCVANKETDNKVVFNVGLAGEAPAGMTMTGRVYAAAGVQPYSNALTRGANNGIIDYTGVVGNIGLAQGSSDGIHGSITAELRIGIPKSASFDADLASLKTILKNIQFTIYYQYKQ